MIKFRFLAVLLLMALIGVVVIKPVHAAGLKIPVGHTFNVNTSTLNTSGNVDNEGALQLSTGEIRLNGNWSNISNRGHPLVGPCQAQKTSLVRKK